MSIGASVVNQVLLLVTGVVAARALGVQGRGEIALLALLAFVAQYVASLGLPQSLTYYIASRGTTAQALLRRLRVVVWLQLAGSTAAFAIACWLVSPGDSPAFLAAAGISAVTPAGLLALRYAYAIVQGQQRFATLNSLRLVQPAAYALALSSLLVVGVVSVPAVAAAYTLSVVIGAVCLTIASRRPGPAVIVADTPPARAEAVRFGLKGFLSSASPVDTLRLDQAIAGLVLSPAALGLYTSGVAFTSLPRLVAQGVSLVGFPAVAATRQRGEARRLAIRLVGATAVVLALIVGALALSASLLLPLLFGDEFAPAVPLARLLLVAAFFAALRSVLAEVVRGLGAPGATSLSELLALAVFLGTMLALVPAAGLRGLALSLLLGSLTGAAVLFVRMLCPPSQPRVERPARTTRLLSTWGATLTNRRRLAKR